MSDQATLELPNWSQIRTGRTFRGKYEAVFKALEDGDNSVNLMEKRKELKFWPGKDVAQFNKQIKGSGYRLRTVNYVARLVKEETA